MAAIDSRTGAGLQGSSPLNVRECWWTTGIGFPDANTIITLSPGEQNVSKLMCETRHVTPPL